MTCIRSDNTAVPVSFCGESGSSLSKTIITSQACLNKALWAAGEWQPWSTQCGNAARSRDVICQRDGVPVADDQCVDPKPSIAEASEIYTGCTYQMITTGQTEWSACTNGQQTMQVTQVCQRSDGTNVDIAFCGQTQNVFEQARLVRTRMKKVREIIMVEAQAEIAVDLPEALAARLTLLRKPEM